MAHQPERQNCVDFDALFVYIYYMRNYWIELRELRESIEAGDYIYWRREIFNSSEWKTILLQFGTGPMFVVSVYWESVFDDFRLEVNDSNHKLILGVDPKKVRKVDEDFKAK